MISDFKAHNDQWATAIVAYVKGSKLAVAFDYWLPALDSINCGRLELAARTIWSRFAGPIGATCGDAVLVEAALADTAIASKSCAVFGVA